MGSNSNCLVWGETASVDNDHMRAQLPEGDLLSSPCCDCLWGPPHCYCELFPGSRKPKTYLHLEEDKEYMEFNFIVFCALITILHYLWLLQFISALWECVECCCDSMLSSPHQTGWCEMLKVLLYSVLFVHSWVQGKATCVPALHQIWCLGRSSDALQKVSYINKEET